MAVDRQPRQPGPVSSAEARQSWDVAFSEVVMPFGHVSGYSFHNIVALKRTTVCLNLNL
jgi:hypothetical protein